MAKAFSILAVSDYSLDTIKGTKMMNINQIIELTKITSLPGIEKGDILSDNLLKYVLSEG